MPSGGGTFRFMADADETDDYVIISDDPDEPVSRRKRPTALIRHASVVRPLERGPWIACPVCAKPIRLWQNGDGAIDSYQHEGAAEPCRWWSDPDGGQAWMRTLVDVFGQARGGR
jgi:hypothetical protein